MSVIVAQQLVAIAYREAMLRSVRRAAGMGLLVVAMVAYAVHSCGPILAGVAVTWILSLVASRDTAARIRRITGMTHTAQTKLWRRYRTDVRFAMAARVVLASDGLPRALDEISRSFERRAAVLERHLHQGIRAEQALGECVHVLFDAEAVDEERILPAGRSRRRRLRPGPAGGRSGGAAARLAKHQEREIARLQHLVHRLVRRLEASGGPMRTHVPG